MSGEIIARGLGIISIPFLTRIYSPEDFGLLAIFNSVVIILAPIGTLKMSQAIVLPEKESRAFDITILISILSVLFLVINIILLFFFSEYVFYFFSLENLNGWGWLIAFSIFFANLYEILSNWSLRNEKYLLLSKSKLIQAISGESIKLGFGLLGFKPLGLILGQIFNRSGGLIGMFSFFLVSFRRYFYSVSVRKFYLLFLKYLDFPKYKLPSYFIFTLSSQLLPLIVNHLYGEFYNGQVSLTMSLLALPVSLIGQSISQVYFKEISKKYSLGGDHVFTYTKRMVIFLFGFSIPVFLILFLFGELLFSIFFGSDWVLAGEFSGILSLFVLTQLVAAPLMTAYIVFNQQKKTLGIHIFRLASIIVIFLFSKTFSLSIKQFLYIYSIFLSIHYLVVVFKVFKLTKIKRDENT